MVHSTRRFVLCLTLCYFVLVFFSPFSIAITSLGEERANLSAFRTFVRFALCLVLSVSFSSWCLARTAVCDCGTPWTFLLPLNTGISIKHGNKNNQIYLLLEMDWSKMLRYKSPLSIYRLNLTGTTILTAVLKEANTRMFLQRNLKHCSGKQQTSGTCFDRLLNIQVLSGTLLRRKALKGNWR